MIDFLNKLMRMKNMYFIPMVLLLKVQILLRKMIVGEFMSSQP